MVRPADAAWLAVANVNEMVKNSTSRNSTPVIGRGEPLFYEDLHLRSKINRTSIYNNVIQGYHDLVVKVLNKHTNLGKYEIKSHNLGKYMSEIARQAIITKCGDCQEMSYVGCFFLRNNGFQGRIKYMEFGPANDCDANLYIRGQPVSVQKHCFLMLEKENEEPWVADIWSKKHYPLSVWRDKLKGYGTIDVNNNTMCYGILMNASEIPREVPRLKTDFSSLFPPLP